MIKHRIVIPHSNARFFKDNIWQRTRENCWEQCEKKGGRCPFCGENGFCCRGERHPTWNGNCPIQSLRVARTDEHDCVAPIKGMFTSKLKSRLAD